MAKSMKKNEKKSIDSNNQEDEREISMYMVKEMMKVQQETMLACFNNTVKNLSDKVDSIMCDVQELKTSLNFMGVDQREALNKINADVTIMKKDLSNTQLLNSNDRNMVKQHSEKLVDLEDRSRRSNLRIDGLRENEKETWEETEIKVKHLFRNELGITEEVEVDRAHRVGRKEEGKVRTIVLRCHNYKMKEEIKRAAPRLKDTGIYINDDFSLETLLVRKDLFKTAKELRRQGKGAKVVKDRLVTWDRRRDDGTERSDGEH